MSWLADLLFGREPDPQPLTSEQIDELRATQIALFGKLPANHLAVEKTAHLGSRSA